MNKDKVIRAFGRSVRVAEHLKIDRSAIAHWGPTIPQWAAIALNGERGLTYAASAYSKGRPKQGRKAAGAGPPT